MAKDCWSKKNPQESNVTTSNQKNDSDEEWETEASVTLEEKKLALAIIILGQINYKSNQTID